MTNNLRTVHIGSALLEHIYTLCENFITIKNQMSLIFCLSFITINIFMRMITANLSSIRFIGSLII
jgi:hypothetical protein